MASPAQIPLEQYLHTSYRPDREYVDCEVRERHLGLPPHSRTQALLAGWFGRHEQLWSVIGLIAPRVQVSPSRIRVPDYALVTTWHQQDITEPPLLVIEIVSPEDTYSHTQVRVQDYLSMGVKNVCIVDPHRVIKSCFSNP
jgi:Uma2 family endonuclease